MDRTFKYVDKDRLLPWIDKQIAKYSAKHGIANLERVALLKELRMVVVDGVLDWQPAE